jgi:cyclopropane-fatty-acyl-phospholipid synthase
MNLSRPSLRSPGTIPQGSRAVNHAKLDRSTRTVLALLARLTHGSLALELPNGQTLRFGQGQPEAQLQVSDWRVFALALKSGDVGFAQAYIEGQWSSPNLLEVLNILVLNRTQIEHAIYGSFFGRLLYRVKHWLNRNSREGSRKNIHAHYDLGNAFYTQWLDPGMTYSSALGLKKALTPGQTATLSQLETAQDTKYQRILSQLQLNPGDSLLEIGCGWGGFAQAAQQAQLKVTGLTLSTEQLSWAKERSNAQFLLQDYRDTNGQYDGIASIEMFEAVGEAYWADYFACLQRNLVQGGRAVIQTITIADALFERYRHSTDFIQQYIFPGGMLPSPSAFKALAAKHGFKVVNEFAFGADYAATLACWRQQFMQKLDTIQAIQSTTRRFDQAFARTWEFYLVYCEAAFNHGNTDVYHFTLVKERA